MQNLAQNFVGPASIVSKTSNAVVYVSISRNETGSMRLCLALEWNLNAPRNFNGLSVVQTLQLGKDLLVSLYEIGELVDQP